MRQTISPKLECGIKTKFSLNWKTARSNESSHSIFERVRQKKDAKAISQERKRACAWSGMTDTSSHPELATYSQRHQAHPYHLTSATTALCIIICDVRWHCDVLSKVAERHTHDWGRMHCKKTRFCSKPLEYGDCSNIVKTFMSADWISSHWTEWLSINEQVYQDKSESLCSKNFVQKDFSDSSGVFGFAVIIIRLIVSYSNRFPWFFWGFLTDRYSMLRWRFFSLRV